MQPPLTDTSARSSAVPKHAQPQGPGCPGFRDTALSITACTWDSATALGQARTSSAAGQREITPAAAQRNDSYLLLGIHTNT